MNEFLCPKCGKQMEEQPRFLGLWQCPDYRSPINDSPPFQYKCDGMKLTDAGAQLLEDELFRQSIQRN